MRLARRPAWSRRRFVLVYTVEPLEHDALRRETPDRGGNISDSPAENGVAGVRYFSDRRHAQHRAIRVKYAREVVLLDHRQAELQFVQESCGQGTTVSDGHCRRHRVVLAR